MIIALVQNDTVVGLYSPSSDEELASVSSLFEAAVDVTNQVPAPQIGWLLIGNQLRLSDGSTPVDWRISKLALNQRFTVTEMLGILNYVGTNPSSLVALLMQRLGLATFIDLSRSDTQAGIGALAAFGLLTSARVTEIISTPPTATEHWTG